MNEIVKQIYQEENDSLGYTQKYKDIEFYPILVKDLEYIKLFGIIFKYPKLAASSTKRIFKMSYLHFALQEMGIGGDNLVKFFKYITKRKDVKLIILAHQEEKFEKLSDFENALFQLEIGNTIFSEQEFENLREIVLEQNGSDINYINEYREDLEADLRWTQKEYPLTFNDQISTIASLYRTFPKQIGELTLWQLEDLFDRRVTEKQFDIYALAIAKKEITMKGGKSLSYLYHKEKKGRYDGILMGADEFSKIEAGLKDKNSI